MTSEKLALYGGSKLITKPFKPYKTIEEEELLAATEVIKSGVLSKFLGCWDNDFFGGVKVQQFEKECADYFDVKHVVTVNSWTSGLICALGAIGIEPGDEVITTPWTMCATATSILHWNAIPVFADIEDKTFNLDPSSVEKNISENTKAILAVDIFGHSCDVDALNSIAKKYNLKLITDSAQAPGVFNKNRLTGTLADVGGFSLNYHKHIHTGEGGILITEDDEICERMQLIRNHAEAVVGNKGVKNLVNMVGYNFRLGEIEAAIGIEQLKKLKTLVSKRQLAAERLTNGLKSLRGIITPTVVDGNSHAYYIYPITLENEKLNVNRELLVKALTAEGIGGLINGFANLHLLPIYQEKIAFGSKGFPWNSDICKRQIDYSKGICPVAENLHDKTFIGFEICLYDLELIDCDLIVDAFYKVWNNLEYLID